MKSKRLKQLQTTKQGIQRRVNGILRNMVLSYEHLVELAHLKTVLVDVNVQIRFEKNK